MSHRHIHVHLRATRDAGTPEQVKARYAALRAMPKEQLISIAQRSSRLDVSHLKSEDKSIIVSMILENEFGRKSIEAAWAQKDAGFLGGQRGYGSGKPQSAFNVGQSVTAQGKKGVVTEIETGSSGYTRMVWIKTPDGASFGVNPNDVQTSDAGTPPSKPGMFLAERGNESRQFKNIEAAKAFAGPDGQVWKAVTAGSSGGWTKVHDADALFVVEVFEDGGWRVKSRHNNKGDAQSARNKLMDQGSKSVRVREQSTTDAGIDWNRYKVSAYDDKTVVTDLDTGKKVELKGQVRPVSEAIRQAIKAGLTTDAGDVRIVYNKLLGGWYIVRGPYQTSLGGRFNSKEEAQAHLQRQAAARESSAPRYERTASMSFKVDARTRSARDAGYSAYGSQGSWEAAAKSRFRGVKIETVKRPGGTTKQPDGTSYMRSEQTDLLKAKINGETIGEWDGFNGWLEEA